MRTSVDWCGTTWCGELRDSISCWTTSRSLYVHFLPVNRYYPTDNAQHLAFSPEFTAAVEAKQVAQQEAQRAAFVVDKARQEKQATVVRAQGEARSAELIGDAIKKSRSYVDLREFENARNIAQILQQSSNKVYLDSKGLGLDISQTTADKEQRAGRK